MSEKYFKSLNTQKYDDVSLPEQERLIWLEKSEQTFLRALELDKYYVGAAHGYGNLLMGQVG
jgi:hypothetical protein